MIKFCPYCEKEHEIVLKKIKDTIIVNKKPITYYSKAYYCSITNQYFEDGHLLNENLANFRKSKKRVNKE